MPAKRKTATKTTAAPPAVIAPSADTLQALLGLLVDLLGPLFEPDPARRRERLIDRAQRLDRRADELDAIAKIDEAEGKGRAARRREARAERKRDDADDLRDEAALIEVP